VRERELLSQALQGTKIDYILTPLLSKSNAQKAVKLINSASRQIALGRSGLKGVSTHALINSGVIHDGRIQVIVAM